MDANEIKEWVLEESKDIDPDTHKDFFISINVTCFGENELTDRFHEDLDDEPVMIGGFVYDKSSLLKAYNERDYNYRFGEFTDRYDEIKCGNDTLYVDRDEFECADDNEVTEAYDQVYAPAIAYNSQQELEQEVTAHLSPSWDPSSLNRDVFMKAQEGKYEENQPSAKQKRRM